MLGLSQSQLLFFSVGKICSPMNESLLWHPPQQGRRWNKRKLHILYIHRATTKADKYFDSD